MSQGRRSSTSVAVGLSLAVIAGTLVSGCLGGIGGEEDKEHKKTPLEWEPAGTWTEIFRQDSASPGPIAGSPSGLVATGVSCCKDGYEFRIYLAQRDGQPPGPGQGFHPPQEIFRDDFEETTEDTVAATAVLEDNVHLIMTPDHRDNPNLFRRYNLQHRTMYEEPYPDMLGDESFHLGSRGRTVVADGTIYIVGGCCGPPRIWAWDPDVDEMWKVTDIPLPDGDDQHIEGFEPVLDGSDILIWYDNGSYHEGNEKYYALRYNLTTDNWSPPRQLPQSPTELIAHEGEIWQFYRYCLFEWQPDGTYQAGVGPPPYHNLGRSVQWNGEIYLHTEVFHPSWMVDAEDQSALYQWMPPDPEAWPPPPPSEEGSEQAERRASCERLAHVEDSEQGTS